MSLRVYLMPITGTGTNLDPRRPKYADTHLSGFDYQSADYGDEPTCLVASDIGAGHAALAAEVDVTSVPADLTQNIAGQLATVQSTLEASNIPADWVKSTYTYRQLIKGVYIIFFIARGYQGLGFGRIFTTGVTLDTTFNSLPANVRQNLLTTARSLKLGLSNLDGSSTLRQILFSITDQLRESIPFGNLQ